MVGSCYYNHGLFLSVRLLLNHSKARMCICTCFPLPLFIFFVDFRVRVPYPFQWGSPTFDVGDVFGIFAAAFASLVEVTFSSLRFHSVRVRVLVFESKYNQLLWLTATH